MRKYDVLKLIFESTEGDTPVALANKMHTSLPNVYVYLKELETEGLVRKNESGGYAVNRTNEKLKQILDLQAMCPDRFHLLITPLVKTILEKLSQKIKVEREVFTSNELGKIEKIAIPLRIILKLSKRPVIYSLKINEPLVKSLLEYHGLIPSFTEVDFQRMIGNLTIKKQIETGKSEESDEHVKSICEGAYKNNEDTILLQYAKTLVIDDRIKELLNTANMVNKEYTLFLNALDDHSREAILDRWQEKYIYNTNSIEGNTMSEKQVEDYLKSGAQAHVSKREIHETNNILDAIRFLKIKRNEDLNEDLIKEIHFMVQKNIVERPGEYKNFYNYIKPSAPTTPPQHVKERMKMLLEWYKENKEKIHPFVLATLFHMQFEVIHPFPDGNGRVGRLIMNHILEQNNIMPLTILEKSKQVYYNALANRSLPQFLLYAITMFIEEYKR